MFFIDYNLFKNINKVEDIYIVAGSRTIKMKEEIDF